GWAAFVTVQLQGLLGGLRVVLFHDEIGIFHAVLAQLFFILVCAIALMTSSGWEKLRAESQWRNLSRYGAWASGIASLLLVQLVLGAAMRHQHAGLAIPDFPLAYGKWLPAMDH